MRNWRNIKNRDNRYPEYAGHHYAKLLLCINNDEYNFEHLLGEMPENLDTVPEFYQDCIKSEDDFGYIVCYHYGSQLKFNMPNLYFVLTKYEDPINFLSFHFGSVNQVIGNKNLKKLCRWLDVSYRDVYKKHREMLSLWM